MSVLLAPITVTPTKPLTPSHLKGLLWTDAMYRATAALDETTYRYSPTVYHRTEQTLGFWEYLDSTVGDCDYADATEEEIGALYVRYRAHGAASAVRLRPYEQAAEDGWVHPASVRILRLWAGHYARLGMHDPGLTAHQPPGMALEEVVEHLGKLGLCLDQRAWGGPVYLDATRDGQPLRQIVTAEGRPNYLACVLRELIPLGPCYDEVVLLYDRELDPDYRLLQRVLERAGAAMVVRVPIGRVPINDRVLAARHGDWHGFTAGELLDEASAKHPPEVVRLGMRLYFLAVLGPGEGQSFRHDLLARCYQRARQRLESAPVGEATGFLERQRVHGRHVDPYRLTSSLLARHREPPTRELLELVFL